MVLLQNYEIPLMREKDYTKLGSGMYLNPYSGSGLYLHPYYAKSANHNNGAGFGDTLGSLANAGVNFFKNHGELIGNAANTISDVAYTVKTIKDIRNANKQVEALQAVQQELKNANKKSNQGKLTEAQREILERMKNLPSGSGIKTV